MNFLIIGDVVGRAGRNALQNNLKKSKRNSLLILQSSMVKILLEVMELQEKFMKI